MPHQCTHCGEIYPDAAPELLAGCKCGAKFFYYIRQERIDELNKIKSEDIQDKLTELARADKIQIEKDIREITGMDDEPEKPVILDLESVRVLSPGKFEIDIINLFSKRRPVIYKLEEGKYIIDLTSTCKVDKKELDKKIKNPGIVEKEEADIEEGEEEKEEEIAEEEQGEAIEKKDIEDKENK